MLKKNTSDTPETVARTYLSEFSNGRYTWQTMEKCRMAQIFKECLGSNNIRTETKQSILEVLAQNFT